MRSFLVNPGLRGGEHDSRTTKNWHFVKVYTDEGVDGLGEAFHSLDEPIQGALRKFERWLVGRDPTRITHNWQAIYRGLRYPLGTATMAALSAVEQALWDIAGKACGLPVYRMLGGSCRDRVKVYAGCRSVGGKSLVEAAKEEVRRGFSALKFTPQPDDCFSKSSQTVLAESVERVKAVREAVGNEVEICLDYHGRSLSPTEAIRLAKAIEPYRPFFLEEPALTDNPDALAEVKAKTDIPIAAGERCIHRQCFRQLIDKRAVDVFQPEPVVCGGILETLRRAAVAELYHILIAPHQACSPVSLVVCAHIDACIPNFLIQECNVKLDSRCAMDVIVNLPKIENGYLTLPETPGLGVELNEEAIAWYPPRPHDRPVVIMEDGSVGLE